MTTGELEAKLLLLADIKKIELDLKKELGEISYLNKGAIHATLNMLVSGNASKEDLRQIIEDSSGLEKADAVTPILSLKMRAPGCLEIEKKVNGGTLITGACDSDYGTGQVYAGYALGDTGCTADLFLAEVVSGDLAEAKGLPRDNRSIDLYLWGDIHEEDYTDAVRIESDAIDETVKEIELCQKTD